MRGWILLDLETVNVRWKDQIKWEESELEIMSGFQEYAVLKCVDEVLDRNKEEMRRWKGIICNEEVK